MLKKLFSFLKVCIVMIVYVLAYVTRKKFKGDCDEGSVSFKVKQPS